MAYLLPVYRAEAFTLDFSIFWYIWDFFQIIMTTQI